MKLFVITLFFFKSYGGGQNIALPMASYSVPEGFI